MARSPDAAVVRFDSLAGDGQAQAEAAAGAAGRVGPVKALEEVCKLRLGQGRGLVRHGQKAAPVALGLEADDDLAAGGVLLRVIKQDIYDLPQGLGVARDPQTVCDLIAQAQARS